MKAVVKGGEVNLCGTEYTLPLSMGGEGHYLPILQRTMEQLDAMLSYYSSVLVIRTDIRLQFFTATNELMSKIMRKILKRLKSGRFNQNLVGYVWCREQHTSDAQHYHLILMLNGHKNRHPHNIIKLIEEICEWWDRDFSKPYTPKNCYQVVRRGDQDAKQIFFVRASYLAKVKTKGNRPLMTNDYSSSRIKPKQ